MKLVRGIAKRGSSSLTTEIHARHLAAHPLAHPMGPSSAFVHSNRLFFFVPLPQLEFLV